MNRLMICAAALLLGACGDKSVAGPAIDTDLDPSQTTAATGPAVSPEARSFRDWRAQCDNGNVCAAFGPSTAETAGWIRVSREPGATARPGVVFGLRGDSGSDIPGPLTVNLDGTIYTAAAGAADTAAFVLSDADAVTFMSRLPNARTLTLSAGGFTSSLSVSGSSAALLWIDERQGRLDTVTAVVRKGDRPASVVPAVPGCQRRDPPAAPPRCRRRHARCPVLSCRRGRQRIPQHRLHRGPSRHGYRTLGRSLLRRRLQHGLPVFHDRRRRDQSAAGQLPDLGRFDL